LATQIPHHLAFCNPLELRFPRRSQGSECPIQKPTILCQSIHAHETT
jgi:hypothetical protein